MYVSSIQAVDGQEVIGTTEPARAPETEPSTVIETTSAVSDEPVTDENGEIVTTEPATDENGEIVTEESVTDENGEITEEETTEENSEED